MSIWSRQESNARLLPVWPGLRALGLGRPNGTTMMAQERDGGAGSAMRWRWHRRVAGR
jgi:hypothetical protein